MQSYDRSIYVPVSREVQKYWHMAVIFKIDSYTLGEFGKENSHVPYCQFKRILFFYILYATNKCISGCVFSQIKRTGFVVVLTSKSAF